MGAPTSKPEPSTAAGESTPTDNRGDVKPAAKPDPFRDPAGRFVPRRGVPEAVKSAEQRATEAEAKLALNDPEQIKAQVRAEIEAERVQQAEQAKLTELSQTQKANVERYRRLVETPDAQLSADDYTWREEFKEKLSAFPEVRDFHQTDAELRIQAASDAHNQALHGALTRHVTLPGVDADTFRKLNDWGSIGDHLYQAGARAQQPEIEKRDARIRELEGRVRQLTVSGNGGLGAGRDLAPAGRSSSVVPRDGNSTMNAWLRGE